MGKTIREKKKVFLFFLVKSVFSFLFLGRYRLFFIFFIAFLFGSVFSLFFSCFLDHFLCRKRVFLFSFINSHFRRSVIFCRFLFLMHTKIKPKHVFSLKN